MKIKPLFDRVLLKPHISQQKSNLYTPQENEGNKMIVVSVGEKTNFVVKENDIVLINSYSGSTFYIKNETYVLIKETDILAILEEEN